MTRSLSRPWWPVVLLVTVISVLLTGPPARATLTPERSLATVPPLMPEVGALPAPTDLGSDLRTYMAQPGDQTVVVPAGTYTAGTVTALHPATTGVNKGWLVLVAERPGAAIVDLSETGFVLTGDATGNEFRVLFVGFAFRNGTVGVEGVRDVAFWHCDFSFPAAEWQRQYALVGGRGADAKARNRMANPSPSALRIRSNSTMAGVPNQNIGIHGSDIHDVGDDAIFFHSTSGLTLQGVRIWNVEEGGHDPANWWSNDSIQTTGGSGGIRIEDSYLGQKVQWGAQAGDLADTQARRLWIAGSHTGAWINDVWAGRRLVASSQDDIRAWGNGQTAWGGYQKGFDKIRVDILDGEQRIWNHHGLHGSDRLVMPGTNLTGEPPDGVTMRAGTMTDLRQALDHPDNPANRWRQRHPAHGWPVLLGHEPALAPATEPPSLSEPPVTPEPGALPAPTDLGSDLRTYMAQPGDQTVVVPAGTYTAGTVTALHPATTGVNKGWLVLVAERPGAAIVDLSETGFVLTGDRKGNDVRVLFVGFAFRNGMVRVEGVRNVAFWHCDFSFPAAEWQRQYKAAGGRGADPRARNRMANPFPSAFRMRSDPKKRSATNQNIGIYGSDIHDVGDDAIFFYSTSGLTLQGVRIWNVDEGGHDPADWWHNDSVQTTGGSGGIRIEDSYLGQKVQWGAQAGDLNDLRAKRLWIAGSSTVAWINDVWRGRRMTSSVQEDIRAWGNGQTQRGYQAGHDQIRLDILDGDHRTWGRSRSHGNSRLVMPGSNLTNKVPAGVTMRKGTMTDVREALDHPDNPANLWRAEHPFDGWSTVL